MTTRKSVLAFDWKQKWSWMRVSEQRFTGLPTRNMRSGSYNLPHAHIEISWRVFFLEDRSQSPLLLLWDILLILSVSFNMLFSLGSKSSSVTLPSPASLHFVHLHHVRGDLRSRSLTLKPSVIIINCYHWSIFLLHHPFNFRWTAKIILTILSFTSKGEASARWYSVEGQVIWGSEQPADTQRHPAALQLQSNHQPGRH